MDETRARLRMPRLCGRVGIPYVRYQEREYGSLRIRSA